MTPPFDKSHLVSEIAFAEGARDAFSRLRTANPQTIFDNTFQYDKSPLLFEEINSGTGSITHEPAMSSVVLSTGGTASGAEAILQQRGYNRYQPGKSQLVVMTSIFPTPATNLRSRIGYFDSSGGLFFEQDSNGLKVVIRNTVAGQIVETAVRQGDFNGDNVDGTASLRNASGMDLDTTKHNIYWIDFEWLGAGTVRFGVFYHGQPVVLHSFFNENSKTIPYMPTGNLPLRLEITNTGTTEKANQHVATCQTVISEGGFEKERGNVFSVNNGTTEITVTNKRAILSIRPKDTFNSLTVRGLIELINFELTARTNPGQFDIIYNPTLTVSGGAITWASVNDSSLVQYTVHGDANNGAYTGGMVIESGFVVAGSGTLREGFANAIISRLPIVRDHNGDNPIVITVAVGAMTGNCVTASKLTWKEVR
jgi:hypothetical protein